MTKNNEGGANAPAAKADLRTPLEWAEALGYIVRANPKLPQSETHAKWQHACADALYGWSVHAYNYQAPADRFVISEADYRKALECAAEHPVVAPHEPALPKSQRDRFKDFKAKTATKVAEEQG
jgi:hypothetical protein